MQSRYFAEPTTMIRSQSLRGGNLIKDMPYPIFLPVVVRTMLDVYAYFSGAEWLKRWAPTSLTACAIPGTTSTETGDWFRRPSALS